MIPQNPRNTHYIEMVGATTRMDLDSPQGDEYARTVEFFVDFTLLNWPTSLAATDMPFLGTYTGFGWFEVLVPQNTGSAGAPTSTIKFGTSRNNQVRYSEDATIRLGTRYTMLGKDDGTNAYLWLNGDAIGAAAAAWTTSESSFPFDVKSTFYVGFDDLLPKYFSMRIPEMRVKLNNPMILHYRPDEKDSSATVTDVSPFGNDATLVGTEGTDYYRRTVWNKNVAPMGAAV